MWHSLQLWNILFLHSLLYLVAQLDLKLIQMDIKTAFLYGDLKKDIYLTQPYRFKVGRKEDIVYKLKKSLDSLKQSLKQRYKKFDQFVDKNKYTRSHFDHCVYLKKLKYGSFVCLVLYVDDMLIAPKSNVKIEELKVQVRSKFEIKDI